MGDLRERLHDAIDGTGLVGRGLTVAGQRAACLTVADAVLDALGLERESQVRWEWPEIPEGWRACDNHTLTEGRMWRTVTAAPEDESPYVHEYEFAEATRYEVERWVTPWADHSTTPEQGGSHE